MQKNSLTFLSSRGTGLNADLKLVEKYLSQHNGEKGRSFRFFLNNERAENPMLRQGTARAKAGFCERMTDVVCADASLPFKDLAEGSIRLLLAAPYDYQFRGTRSMEKQKEGYMMGKAFHNFTHIITGSPFTSELFRAVSEQKGIRLIEDVCMPFVWDINQPEQQKKKKEELVFYFPAIERKKVLALVFYGEPVAKNRWIGGFDIRALLDKLGNEWFVLTNVKEYAESSFVLSSRWKDSFGYVNHIMPGQDLLYTADAMVTNSGRFAVYFTSRNRKVYCPAFRGNSFERYMEERHPSIFLRGFSDLLDLDINTSIWEEGQQHFHELMTYKKMCSPYEVISNLFV